MKKYFPFLVTIFFAIFFSANQACAQSSQEILSANKQDLTEIENYLNNIKYLKADFIQESEEKNISKGKLFLSRPGKMRVEYDTPQKLLILVNNNVVAYTDIELDETSYLTTNSTPASFLTRKNFSFSAMDVEITDFQKSADNIRVSILKKNKKTAGTFSLIFKTSPLRFVKMEVKNDLDEITKVSFTKLTFGEEISDKLFIIKNKNLPE